MLGLQNGRTGYAAVRFGNAAGSKGSVISGWVGKPPQVKNLPGIAAILQGRGGWVQVRQAD